MRAAFGIRNQRLISGLVMGLFLLMHFGTIALGLVSVEAMDAALPYTMAPWRSPPGTFLLFGALLVHFGLSLRALYRRRTLRMTYREGAQLALGLIIPFLLASHLAATRLEPIFSGQGPNFAMEVRTFWIKAPAKGVQQSVLLVVAWLHACLGLWFWLRTKAWFPQASATLFTAAVLVPVLALLGLAEAGKQLAALPPPAPPPVAAAVWPDTETLTQGLYLLFGGALVGVFAARLLRRWRGRHTQVRITYPSGQVVTVPKGSTVLEASRMADVAHASMCGGRGRCSTCRVRVQNGLDRLPAPGAQERMTLARFRARPDVRLACQLRPTHDVSVFPIFASTRSMPTELFTSAPASASQERELAILFCDLRGFTRRAEHSLPFDTVFLLNRYFEVVGEAVQRAGGYLDKFIGDGALALFGLDADAPTACRQALAAAARIAHGLEELNAGLAGGLTEPLRVAMGLHADAAIVGQMGYGAAVGLTAIGDGINVASRLEGAAKEFDAQAVVSVELARKAGYDVSLHPQHEITVRGRQAPVHALVVEDAATLAGPVPA